MGRMRYREGQLCNLGFKSESFTAARNSDYPDGIAEERGRIMGKIKRPRIKMRVVYKSTCRR